MLSSSPAGLRPFVLSVWSIKEVSDGVVPLDLEGRPLGAMISQCLGYSIPELGPGALLILMV